MKVIEHLSKLWAEPHSISRKHRLAEVAAFRADARRFYRASMQQRIDLDALFADALEIAVNRVSNCDEVLATLAGNPFGLDALLDRTVSAAALVELLPPR